MDDVLKIAKNCRHYAMCKIDFLGSGVCASGLEKQYVSYYPEGRMDLYAALAEGRIPVTERSRRHRGDLRPLRQVRLPVLFRHGAEAHAGHGSAEGSSSPPTCRREGRSKRRPRMPCSGTSGGSSARTWATNDKAIAVTYSHDPGPLTVPKMPAYVVLPGTPGGDLVRS